MGASDLFLLIDHNRVCEEKMLDNDDIPDRVETEDADTSHHQTSLTQILTTHRAVS